MNNLLEKRLKKFYNLIDIASGLVSELGELPDSYWKSNLWNDVYYLLSKIKTYEDIILYENEISKIYYLLIDGFDGWIASGRSVESYGDILLIERKY